jgi:hypothetical protein
LEDLGVDGKILEYISEEWGGNVRTGFIWLRIGTNGGDETSGSTRSGEFLDYQSDC